MSTDETNRSSSQGKPENSKQGNSSQPQGKPGDVNHRPLPFDDDDGNNAGDPSPSSNGTDNGGVEPEA